MAWTQAQLDALRAAYASGVTRVTVNGKTVEYRSLAEMSEAIGRIERSLEAASGRPRPLAGYAGFRRD